MRLRAKQSGFDYKREEEREGNVGVYGSGRRRTADAVEAVLLEAAALRDVLADGVHGYMLRHAAVEGGVEVRDRVRAWERLDARLDHRQRAAVVPVVQCSSGKRPDRQASVGNNLE